MDAKISKITELSKFLEDKKAVVCDWLSLSGKFQLGRITRDAGFTKEKDLKNRFCKKRDSKSAMAPCTYCVCPRTGTENQGKNRTNS